MINFTKATTKCFFLIFFTSLLFSCSSSEDDVIEDIPDNTEQEQGEEVINENFRPFITIWKTDNEGASDDNQLEISTIEGEVYDYNIDWGDGNTDENVTGNITHTYSEAGTYQVAISGVFPGIINADIRETLITQRDGRKLLSIEQWGDIKWSTMAFSFADCSNLLTIANNDSPNLTDVTSMDSMFTSASSFNADLNSWDVSNVVDISFMFTNCQDFNGIISSWDVSSVTNMSGTFLGAESFNGDISSWDVSNVTDMSFLFSRSAQEIDSAFNGDISSWDVSNVTDMRFMFLESKVFNGDISSWDVSSVIDMSFMFNGTQLFNGNVSSWDISNVRFMSFMFDNSGLTTANYDAILNTWSQLQLQQNVDFSARPVRYSLSSKPARDVLTNNFGWDIADGGMAF